MIIAGDNGDLLVIGRVVMDAEKKTFGEKNWTRTKIVIDAGEGKELITAIAKFELGNYCASFKKNNRVLVHGSIESREYNEKVYTDLILDFACKQPFLASKSTSVAQLPTQDQPQPHFSDVSMDDCPF